MGFAFQLGVRFAYERAVQDVGNVWTGTCMLYCHADVTLDDGVLLGNAEQGGAGGQDPGGEQPEV